MPQIHAMKTPQEKEEGQQQSSSESVRQRSIGGMLRDTTSLHIFTKHDSVLNKSGCRMVEDSGRDSNYRSKLYVLGFKELTVWLGTLGWPCCVSVECGHVVTRKSAAKSASEGAKRGFGSLCLCCFPPRRADPEAFFFRHFLRHSVLPLFLVGGFGTSLVGRHYRRHGCVIACVSVTFFMLEA